jgi:hypothetical protein
LDLKILSPFKESGLLVRRVSIGLAGFCGGHGDKNVNNLTLLGLSESFPAFRALRDFHPINEWTTRMVLAIRVKRAFSLQANIQLQCWNSTCKTIQSLNEQSHLPGKIRVK